MQPGHVPGRAARLYAQGKAGLRFVRNMIRSRGCADALGRTSMLLNRSEISADKSFNLLTEAILERDQPKTTDLFAKMVQGGQSIGDALSVVTAAEEIGRAS